jgi:hypothetical protein
MTADVCSNSGGISYENLFAEAKQQAVTWRDSRNPANIWWPFLFPPSFSIPFTSEKFGMAGKIVPFFVRFSA